MTTAAGFMLGAAIFAVGYRMASGHWPWQWP